MSDAWEVTSDDVFVVMGKHNRVTRPQPAEVELAFDSIDAERVEKAALAYNNMSDQQDSALSEIEDILLEEKFISGLKQFHPPEICS
jgi:hypothetical protein